MGAELPKQYLPLHGKPILAHALDRLSRHPRILGVAVAVAADDRWWPEVADGCEGRVFAAPGGAERCHSVLNALEVLVGPEVGARPDDWVLVHDAVRPCLRVEDIDALMDTLGEHPVGGLLGLPVRDTMKRADGDGEVVETVPRDRLWHALTPQMFRLEALAEALRQANAEGTLVTDEAQAMERAGFAPCMVEGHEDNIKVTRPQDLRLAELYLGQLR